MLRNLISKVNDIKYDQLRMLIVRRSSSEDEICDNFVYRKSRQKVEIIKLNLIGRTTYKVKFIFTINEIY